MIDVGEGWVIDVDKYQYIAGKRKPSKDGTDRVQDPHYVRTLSAAIADICERAAKERLEGKEMNLVQAVLSVDSTYREFGSKIDKLQRALDESRNAQSYRKDDENV